MANSFLSLQIHLVFSTKNRERWINESIEQQVWSYLAGIIRAHDSKAIQIGGFDDHIHILMSIPATITISDLVKRIKGESSKWISNQWPHMRDFRWQDGYGAFTLGQSQIADTVAYIRNQRAHHQSKTFEGEYRRFLQIHGIEVDEKYIFG